jgi:hypothetical protein
MRQLPTRRASDVKRSLLRGADAGEQRHRVCCFQRSRCSQATALSGAGAYAQGSRSSELAFRMAGDDAGDDVGEEGVRIDAVEACKSQ